MIILHMVNRIKVDFDGFSKEIQSWNECNRNQL